MPTGGFHERVALNTEIDKAATLGFEGKLKRFGVHFLLSGFEACIQPYMQKTHKGVERKKLPF